MKKYIDPINSDRLKSLDNVSTLETTLKRIEINPVELCNRTCVFCPRHDNTIYPNRNLHMDIKTAESIAMSLEDMKYTGRVTFSGFGEPLLHNNILKLVQTIKRNNSDIERLQLITNGDKLTRELAIKLYSVGIDRIEIDLYDGEYQIDVYNKMLQGIPEQMYCLRHHYFGPEKDYGLTLNNRAGAVKTIKKPKNPLKRGCYLPFYKLMIDWNGDILLCCQDWRRRGNVNLNVNNYKIKDIWLSSELNKYRKSLSNHNRDHSPCDECNIDGTMNGESSFLRFKEVL